MKKKNKEEKTIVVSVNDVEQCFSQFSDHKNGTPFLCDELSNYLEKNASEDHAVDKLKLLVQSENKATQKEKDLFVESVKKQFKRESDRENKVLKRQDLLSFSLLGIGIVFLIIMQVITHYKTPLILEMFLEIIAWVFVWEFVDVLGFKRFEVKHKLKTYNLLKNADIIFDPNKN